ncbi:SET domain-containing protein-lysine N-methyltransferase [Thiocapsa imhoffii]|uniref:SET domain-containing protein-lysine N-methyltransferase n=1 Tax=Thiocapsa imhoffii TaxID=382777 RepID=A0A9X1B984_9GAMM|nr:SET domain-containing protein [Thiocapsa imhoffii]MBK1645694.1 SET domain-containing protein-lysine N-methyltransferase [Thiocapsa imhoffii]
MPSRRRSSVDGERGGRPGASFAAGGSARKQSTDQPSPRLYRAASIIHGQGCFAKVSFEPGELIGVYEGPEVCADGPHVLWIYDADAGVLRGRDGRNLLRWLNHSEEPNAEFDGFTLYALRRIGADEEITIDYSGV